MKRILALIMSTVLAAAVLAGCGSSGETAQSAASDVQQAAGSTAESASKEESAAETAAESAASTAESQAESTAPALENNKVALLFSSVFMDGGGGEASWNKMHELADRYGLDVTYQENITDTEAMDVIRNYASEGYGLIVDCEQYHSEQIYEISAEFPDTKFAVLNGYMGRSPNFWSIAGDMWGHVYLAGVMAGCVTKTNKIGIITYSTNSDSALTMKQALTEGVAQVNPDAEVIHVATGSFSDLQAGKEMAVSLAGQGCDVIYCNSGDCNETVMQYCIDNGIYTISAVVDRNDMDANYVIGSAMMPPDPLIEIMVGAYVDGTFEGSDEVAVWGIAEGIEEFRVNENLPDTVYTQEVKDALAAAEAGIADGSIKVVLNKN